MPSRQQGRPWKVEVRYELAIRSPGIPHLKILDVFHPRPLIVVDAGVSEPILVAVLRNHRAVFLPCDLQCNDVVLFAGRVDETHAFHPVLGLKSFACGHHVHMEMLPLKVLHSLAQTVLGITLHSAHDPSAIVVAHILGIDDSRADVVLQQLFELDHISIAIQQTGCPQVLIVHRVEISSKRDRVGFVQPADRDRVWHVTQSLLYLMRTFFIHAHAVNPSIASLVLVLQPCLDLGLPQLCSRLERQAAWRGCEVLMAQNSHRPHFHRTRR
mmetsp:Transcript_18465/g.40371  ORF Transcript_18465/g.40371 Transcript_18465/m.40371 type:complete len:270 (+) Transcript_18465:166-975(+)